MTDDFMFVMGEDNKFKAYNSEYDITIHCESEAEQLEVLMRLNTAEWHNPEEPPTDSRFILLSFSNFSIPLVGRYEGDEDGGGNFYQGDDDEPTTYYDLYVNGWMELPKCRKDGE